jgi:hypothetical protein
VDLLAMAIGPVHHVIELVHARSGKYCGKLICNIQFTQIQEAKIDLLKFDATIDSAAVHI